MKKIFWLVVLLAFLPMLGGAATFRTPAVFGDPVDTVYAVFFHGADSTKTTGRATVQSYDTTWTVAYGEYNYVIYYYKWLDGDTVFSRWRFDWEGNAYVPVAQWGSDSTATGGQVAALINDTLAGRGIVATAANLALAIDSINAILDTLQVTDTRWDSTLAVLADANTQFKNRLLRIRDSVDAILDSLQLYDGRWALKTTADSALQKADTARQWAKVAVDTLQNQDNWIAKAANLQLALDSINAILDTLQLYDQWLAHQSSVDSTMKWADTAKQYAKQARDTVLLYDTRFDSLLAAASNASFLAKIWNVAFSTGFTAGSMGDSLNNSTYVQGAAGVWSTDQRDSLLNFAADANTQVKNRILRMRDSIDAILDTLQLHDTRFDSLLAAATNASFLAKIWNISFGTAFTAGSLGDSINNATYMQGAVSGLTLAQVDSVARLAIHDSTIAASDLQDYLWANVDSASFDTTDLAAWFIANIVGGTGSDTASIKTMLLNNLFARTSDSLTLDVSNALTSGGLIGWIAHHVTDSVWNELTSGHNTTGTFGAANGDSLTSLDTLVLHLWNVAFSTGFTAGSMGDSLTNATYVQGSAGVWSTAQRDSLLAFAADANTQVKDRLLRMRDSIDAILDSLQSQDGWGAKEASVTIVRDTLALYKARWDSLLAFAADANTQVKNRLLRVKDSVDAVLDSLQLHDTRLDSLLAAATNASFLSKVWNIAFGTSFTAGSMGDSLNNATYVQGAAAGLSAAEILDSLYGRGTSAFADAWWHNLALRADSGGSASSNWTDNQRDSVLAAIKDASMAAKVWNAAARTLSAFGFSVSLAAGQPSNLAESTYTKFTAGTNEDAFKADVSGLSTFDPASDSVYTKVDNDTTLVQFLRVIQTAIAAIGVSGSNWSDVQRDSILAAVKDAAIRAKVWYATQASFDSTGTFGKYLDAEISTIAGLSGSGAYTYTVTVLDTGQTVDSVLPRVVVYVNNRAQSATPYQSTTNNNGVCTFNLNAGNWVMFTTEPGYATKVDSFTVSAIASDTLKLYRDAGAMTTVAFQFDKPNGVHYGSAQMTIDLVSVHDSSFLKIGDSVIVSYPMTEITATANSTGLASVNLYANSLFTNDSTYYQAVVRDSKSHKIVDLFAFRVPVADTTVWAPNLTRWKP